MMSASSEKFELAQDDLDAILELVLTNLDLMDSKVRGRRRRDRSVVVPAWRDCETRVKSQLRDARSLIQELDGEARMAPATFR
jgi:hypothetical protein